MVRGHERGCRGSEREVSLRQSLPDPRVVILLDDAGQPHFRELILSGDVVGHARQPDLSTARDIVQGFGAGLLSQQARGRHVRDRMKDAIGEEVARAR